MACEDWYARDFLVRDVLAAGAELVTLTQARMPDGKVVELPAPCDHPADCCPRLPVGVPAGRHLLVAA